MRTLRQLFALGVSAAILVSVASCMSAKSQSQPTTPQVKEPPPPPASPPADAEPQIRDAMSEIAHAQQLLDDALPAARPESAPRRSAGGAAPSQPKPQAGSHGAREEESPCAIACRALASMQSSAKHLCQLTSSADARCGEASTRVDAATSRVRASCGACPSG